MTFKGNSSVSPNCARSEVFAYRLSGSKAIHNNYTEINYDDIIRLIKEILNWL